MYLTQGWGILRHMWKPLRVRARWLRFRTRRARQKLHYIFIGPPISKKKQKTDVPPILVWVRAIGGVAVLVGGVSMIQPPTFWFGISAVYLGFTLLGIDLWLEPKLRRWIKISGTAIIALLCTGFTRSFVLVPAPLGVSAMATIAEYPTGTTIAGIPWKPYYTEETFLINNPTDEAYTDIELVLHPDHPVVTAAQKTSLPNVLVQEEHDFGLRMSMDQYVVPFVLVASNTSYNVHCDRLPARSALEILVVLVDFKPQMVRPGTGLPSPTLMDPTEDKFVMRALLNLRNGQQQTYWYAHQGNETFYAPRPIPESAQVSGSYVASNRRRKVDLQLKVTH